MLSIDGLNGKKEVIHPSALRKFGMAEQRVELTGAANNSGLSR